MNNLLDNIKVKWEAHAMKPETKELYVKNAIIFKEVHRPSVRNLFGIRPITTYHMSVSRTRYYEYKKLGLNVKKAELKLGDQVYVDYYVEVTPRLRNDFVEKDFLLKAGPVRFTYYKAGRVAKLYFSKEDMGKTRYSK